MMKLPDQEGLSLVGPLPLLQMRFHLPLPSARAQGRLRGVGEDGRMEWTFENRDVAEHFGQVQDRASDHVL